MSGPIVTFTAVRAVPSLCINICSIDPHDGHCEGCRRTLDEIARWTTMPAAERDRIMGELKAR